VKKFLYILLILSLTGCGLLKDTQRTKTKTHTEVKETGVRIVKIPKDSIVYVPNVVIKQKDTTITVENKNLVLKTTYRNRRVKKITAVQKPKEQKELYEKTETKDEKVKDLKSDGLLKPIYFLYVFSGLTVLIIANNLTKKS